MEITNVSYFKVAGHNIKMNVTYFRMPRPGYGQNTRSLISYTSLKFLSLGQFLGGWAYNSVQKYYVLSNISQATHLLVQFTFGHIESRVPCPYTMHGAQYLHAHGKGCSEGWNGGGGGGEGGVFTAVHLHPVEEHLSRNDGGGCLALVDVNLILHVV